jgi:hypothetical protein
VQKCAKKCKNVQKKYAKVRFFGPVFPLRTHEEKLATEATEVTEKVQFKSKKQPQISQISGQRLATKTRSHEGAQNRWLSEYQGIRM